MKAIDYLVKNRNNIIHYNEVKQIIDDLRDHRDNLGTILEYCHQNLMCFDLEKREKIQLKLLKVLEKDKTYCLLYHLIKSDLEKKETASTPYWVDESNVTERYHANLVKEQEKDEKYTLEWWQKLEQQVKQAIEQENRNTKLIISENLLKSLQKKDFIENSDIFPLNWKGTLKELNYFINKYFPNEPNKWEKSINLFVWNNSKINKKSLSTAIDKYDNNPERSIIIDNL